MKNCQNFNCKKTKQQQNNNKHICPVSKIKIRFQNFTKKQRESSFEKQASWETDSCSLTAHCPYLLFTSDDG